MKLPPIVARALKLQNSILARYLMRNVLVLLSAVFIVIALVVFGNQLVLVIKESLKEGIPVADLLPLVGFNMIRDVALILSLSLLLAIILSISKLYKDSEAIVMNSLGLGDKYFMIFIQPLVIFVFIFVLLLTTVVVPWSKQQRGLIMERSENASEFSFIKESEFQEFKNGDIVFYASKVSDADNAKEQNMEEIFIYTLVNNEPVITLAKQAQKYTNLNTNSVYLRLKNGTRYHGFPSDKNKKILNFKLYDLQIIDGEVQKTISTVTKVESKSTFELLFSNKLTEIAEFQWRISQPLSILILSVLGVLLGKTSPRSGKNLGVLVGVVAFIVYNNVLLIAKSALERGEFLPIIGLWWVHLAMLLLIFIFYKKRYTF
ncbi:lipopolysaccharide export system permease protein [Isorropodon fossajaponicum endosymbiont JTNG4]|uniref:LPS export ABC transporter permease LptF n=1 Tax=Isorropodon fossajaponicum symbiont TaxID=883811 RepID=UPI0019154989|nr:LPS export ABC transporter permease LptF [Isorropodon fossajaponicum symbiont]BBB24162.1 lipopolysaccharide export system permease protein [Isorropodon fossajaponicum endosymbiont JTNG4]